jgi:hypothetical protein
MSAIDKIKIFNTIVESFLSQISVTVGTTYYTYFKRMIKINSLIAIDNAVIYMIPLKDKIFNEDETYFTNEDLNTINTDPNIDEILKTNNMNNDILIQEMFRLKDIYYKFDEKSKKEIWKILKTLVQLSIEYCEIKGIKF